MWNHRTELTGKIRARASRWPCGQLVLQVECSVFEIFQIDGALIENCTRVAWRDAETADLNDLCYLSTALGESKGLAGSTAAQAEFFKSMERK